MLSYGKSDKREYWLPSVQGMLAVSCRQSVEPCIGASNAEVHLSMVLALKLVPCPKDEGEGGTGSASDKSKASESVRMD